jgi:hypothetical protein
MADLYNSESEDIPLDQRLKLSIKWLSIDTPCTFPNEAGALLQIGMFVGDVSLLSDALYTRKENCGLPLLPGYFAGEDDDCRLLTDLGELLDTGKRLDFEDVSEPLFRLIIASDLFDPDIPNEPDTVLFEVMVIVQRGGLWHGEAMGETGPAVKLAATQETLRRFFYDLLAEALDPAVCKPEAREILERRFAGVLAHE